MHNRRNYYRILHVQPDAPDAVIRASYRTLMQKLRLHPDLGGDDWNAALLNEAYRTLSDPDRRAAYDRNCEQHRAGRGAGARRGDRSRAGAGPESRPPSSAPRALLCPFCTASNVRGRHYSASDHCVSCHSPLTPAAEIRRVGKDRRSLTRQPVELAATFFTRWPQARGHSGLVTDFSPRGVQLVGDERLPTNAFIKIDAGEFAAIARVASCRQRPDRRYATGLEFITLAIYRKDGLFISESA